MLACLLPFFKLVVPFISLNGVVRLYDPLTGNWYEERFKPSNFVPRLALFFFVFDCDETVMDVSGTALKFSFSVPFFTILLHLRSYGDVMIFL